MSKKYPGVVLVEKNLQNFSEEKAYLNKVLEVLKNVIEIEETNFSKRKTSLIQVGKDMWENSVHFSNDFEKMAEVTQHLSNVANETAIYRNTRRSMERYKRITGSPYFGRFDFAEDGSTDLEKVYIGLCNVADPKTAGIYVYDWRAPISSVYYRHELGKARYLAPYGEITGEVTLKRQYKIIDSELKYFFDSSVTITDEILQEVLRNNSSPKMRNIVETIQKEQDVIIRDRESELLIVQGVAGSGKTSVAMHRVAFLLYQGMEEKLQANNIMIISPNSIFSKYISNVLPGMGEENAEQTSVEEIFDMCFKGMVRIESRNERLEKVIGGTGGDESLLIRRNMEFKGSRVFVEILDRLLHYFEHRLLRFEDVYCNGVCIENRHLLKSSFLDNKIRMPAAKRLKRIEDKILERVHPVQKQRLKAIENIVQKMGGHEFEIKSFSRLLSMRETQRFLERLRKFTRVGSFDIYKMLFKSRALFYRLAKGLQLPADIERIISYTAEILAKDKLPYEDAIALLHLKQRLEGNDSFKDIRQVVVDEAQDYYPIHYELFKGLFGNASYTVMGDVCQTVEKDVGYNLYNDIADILDKRKTVRLFLNKSYRASYEINLFSRRFSTVKQDFESFVRHETKPEIIVENNQEALEKSVVEGILKYFSQGFETVAVLCKTARQAEALYYAVKGRIDIKLIGGQNQEIERGAMIMPVYMAKGLEFDAVLVYGADEKNYSGDLDRKILYIACTRALHRLSLYCAGEKSRFLKLSKSHQ